MKIYKTLEEAGLVETLKEGAVGLVPTDTIYGISCLANNPTSVERVYDIKGRDKGIPVIVLISDIAELKIFHINLDDQSKKILMNNWPGKISFILPLNGEFKYLTRGLKGLAFRMPDQSELLKLLHNSGPLISTSANPSGKKPAENTKEAIKYFGNKLDFYVDLGEIIGSASTLVDLTNSRPTVLRQGETILKSINE